MLPADAISPKLLRTAIDTQFGLHFGSGRMFVAGPITWLSVPNLVPSLISVN